MKTKIIELLQDITGEITCGLRYLCGKPSPVKRLVLVLVIGGALYISFIYTLADAIYSIAKNDAEKEFMEVEHMRRLNLKNDSIRSDGNNNPKEYYQWEKIKDFYK